MPTDIPARLLEKAGQIVQLSFRLSGSLHVSSRATIIELVRSMNSYYSNRIEGHHTHPLNIESALKRNFSEKPDVAKLQRVAVAHIEAERELEVEIANGAQAMSSDFLLKAHESMHSKLLPEDLITEEKKVVIPGHIRTWDVEVANHVPPESASINGFFARMDQVYKRHFSWDMLLIAAACLHHRAVWVHPFGDGNGRATRLQTQCALFPITGGLWSPSRGLARNTPDYYSKLTVADRHRRGDLDGRGNLSTSGLLEWVEFFLDVCLDQVTFMAGMLELDGMKHRIETLISLRARKSKQYRPEAALPLYHVFTAGPVSRAEFSQMTGLGARTARTLISHLLSEKLLVSNTPLGSLAWGLPLDALSILFPELYPEANTRLQ